MLSNFRSLVWHGLPARVREFHGQDARATALRRNRFVQLVFSRFRRFLTRRQRPGRKDVARDGRQIMPDAKAKVYSDDEIPAKLDEHGLTSWYLEDGWLRRRYK